MLHRTSIGLDVHARSIAAAAFIPETGEILQKSFGYDADAVVSWAKALPQPARCVYESGPTGFDLKRKLDESGLECLVGAVSKMIRPSGDRVKTDKRDAVFLARMLAIGNVVECRMPDAATEAARDLARIRADCREDLMRARNRLSKFLLRKGIVYEGGKSAWTRAHSAWLSSISFGDPCEQLVFQECCEDVRALTLKRDRLDGAIAKRAGQNDISATVKALECLRGISTVTAFSLVAEIGDFSRFPDAKSFMSFLGLVPSESSTGGHVSRGKITRTGNKHARTLLVEAAWHHARTLKPLSRASLESAPGVPAAIAEEAARANMRLHGRWIHLRSKGKSGAVANAAIARELAGFVWSIGRMAQAGS